MGERIRKNNIRSYRSAYPKNLVNSDGRIYIAHLLRGVMEYSGTNQTFSASDDRNHALVAYDTSSNFLWVKQYGSTSTAGSGRRDLKANLSSVYFTTYFDKEYINNTDTLDTGNYLIQADTSGSISNYLYIKSDNPLNLGSYSGIKFDIDASSGSVYLAFPFNDSIEILSRKEISNTNTSNKSSFCLLKLDKQLDSIVWCKCRG